VNRRWRVAARASNAASRRLGPLMRWGGRLQARVYEASGGRLGKRFLGTPVFVLEVVGRRSGTLRRVPLLYVSDDNRWAILAANGGNPRAPAWWLNLRAAGRATAVFGRRRIDVTAREATGAERDELLPKLIANYPPVELYEGFANRHIPVVILEPAPNRAP
jgi:deazaflavin-dependent oxidoreductase (nitroreductase family)